MVRGPVSLVIVMAILLAIFGLVAMGPKALAPYLPEYVVAFLETGSVGSVESFGSRTVGSKAAGNAPAEFLIDSSDGLVADGPIAAWAGNVAFFIEDVISGYSKRVSAQVPSEITTIRPILGCGFTPPQIGTVVGHVTAGQSDLRLPMLTYNDEDLAKAIQVFVNVYRKSGSNSGAAGTESKYQDYDVAVTETRAPVYLVLESTQKNRMWNIHLAPGAQIERVILLGGNQAGVANLDPLVPVEVMLTKGAKDCGIVPVYPLNDGHRFFQALENGAMTQREASSKLAVINQQVVAYDQWFRSSFGIGANESRAGWDKGTISFVGPVPTDPDTRAVWATLEGAKIRTTQDTYFEIEGQTAEGTDFKSRVIAIATSFAWGDLANLKQGAKF